MKDMLAKTWIALALGATMLVGGAATVAVAANMNGDCTQDKLQLKDGSCDDCPCDSLGDETEEVCDSCNEYLYDWDFLYGEPGPHSSACGQE
ncbi:MAG: hypothetical protein JSV94_01190 [Methanobacteriota archaeon]|nr:MAG: hypothetical protein JSV94_01190 [Euryarchaeota archaeon]